MSKGDSHSSTHSFVDLMTSLAVIFILLFLGKLAETSKAEDTAVQVVQQFDQEINALLKDLEKKHLDVSLQTDPDDPFVRIVRLKTDTLFTTGKADVPNDKREILSTLFEGLSERICKRKEFFDSVIIEGHTDGQNNETQIGKHQNFHLSVDRAFNVHAAGMSGSDLDCLYGLTSLNGFGASRPKVPLEKGHEFDDIPQNRRVEIKIRFKPKQFMPGSLVKKLNGDTTKGGSI